MNYKLKCIKDYPSMSEETNCFQADIWVGNKKVAHIKNNGRGGCDDIYPYEGMRPLLNEVEDYCKSLPKVKFHDLELDNTLELEIGRIMDEWRNAKDFKKGIIYNKNNKTYIISWKGTTTVKLLKSPLGIITLTKAISKIRLGGGTVLNTNLDSILHLLK